MTLKDTKKDDKERLVALSFGDEVRMDDLECLRIPKTPAGKLLFLEKTFSS